MKRITLLLGIIFLTLTNCTSNSDFDKGKKQLEQQGYTDVVNTGHEWFCCDEKDTFSTGFKCKNAKGETVEGCFCSTALKGVTIRFE